MLYAINYEELSIIQVNLFIFKLVTFLIYLVCTHALVHFQKAFAIHF